MSQNGVTSEAVAAATAQTEKDNATVKSLFQNNEAMLKIMRALFLGLGVTAAEKEQVRSMFSNNELLRIVRNKFYPELSRETPIGQVADVWLGVEQMIFGVPQDTITQAVQYKDLALDMTRKALKLLENPDGEQIDVSYDPKAHLNDPLRINLLARNQYIRHVETQLTALWIIANQKTAETKDSKPTSGKLPKNSAR